MSPSTAAAQSAVQGFQQLGSDTAMNNANQQYDVAGSQSRLSALKGVVGNLQTSLDAVDPSVTGRTTGTFTTEGQRSALVAKEQAPIATNLGKEQTAATSAEQDVTQKQTLASQMAAALVGDNKQQYQRLLDTYNSGVAQDTAAAQKAQQEQQAQQWAQQFAESTRQFNETLAQNARLASQKSASSVNQQPQIVSKIGQALSGATGRDGYVSPQSYAAAKQDWVAQGYGADAFDKTFAGYRNPYSEDLQNGAKRSKADYAVA